ncbi:MAG: hypothetical protein CUN52_00590 [Phototrophicales bacterium]|jgi:hypothetical protein|nr:MAG: hypothetical protein CUN52_00590 [Phototrophicales bacterium]
MFNKRIWIIGMMILIAVFTLPFTVFAQQTISYGQVVTGEINENNPSVSYTFNGNQGDTILARMNGTGEMTLDSYLTLFDPQGNFLYSDDDSGGNRNALVGPVVLPQTGAYTITASSCCDPNATGSTGTYELVVEQVQVPVVAPNQPANFELSNENPVAFFILMSNSVSSPITRAVVDVTNAPAGNWNINMDVRAPLGNSFYSSYIPPASSRYVVDPIITNLIDGAYQIRVSLYTEMPDTPILEPGQKIQATLSIEESPVTPITIGSSVSGTLDDNTPVLYYSFDANMRDLLNLVGEQPTESQPISVTVYEPSGFSVTGASTINYMDGSNSGRLVIDPLRAVNQGTYFIGVSRATYYSPDDIIGKVSTFTLSLRATETPMLQVGVPVTGVFDNPQQYEQVYRYQATANQTIRITLTSLNGGYAPAFDFVGEAFESPDTNIANINSIAPGKVVYEVTLYYDSVYLIRVRNGIFYSFEDVAGEYSLQIDVVE